MDMGYYLLMIILLALGFAAAWMIPTKKKIREHDDASGLNPRFTFVYVIGLGILIIFLFFLITTLIDLEKSLNLPTFINIILTGIIGIGLLVENHNRSAFKSKLESESESLGPRTEVEPEGVEATEVSTGGTTTTTEPQVIKCPKCSKHIRITNPTRPLQIACPHCGVKGEIR